MKILKIIITLLLMMFIPLLVKGKVCDIDKITISSITLENSAGKAIELTDATASGKTVNVDLSMSDVGDNVKYKIIVSNDTDEDFEISNKNININSDYIDYDVTFEDNSNIIKSKSTKTMFLEIKYDRQVAESSFVSGVYRNDQIFKVPLMNDEVLDNPNTGEELNATIIITLGIILVVSIVLYAYLKKKSMIMIIGIVILIPISVYALCKTEVIINAKVTIVTNQPTSTFKISCTGDDEYHFYEGMTFGDWLKSDLYPGNIGGEFASVELCKEVWGENRGCAAVTYENVYSYINNKEERYTDSQEECERGENCVEVNNQYYLFEYADDLYDTLEQCEINYGEGECKSKNNKYGYFNKVIYQTEEECNRELTNNPEYSSSCTLLPKAYKYDDISYSDYYNLEECENNRQSIIDYYNGDDEWTAPDNCFARTIKHYNSPEYRRGTMKGRFDFWDDGATFVYGELESFNYNDVLSSKTYQCVRAGECVSPESDILVGYGKTIKAKDLKENDSIAYYDFKENKIMIGKIIKKYIHKDATSFIKYTLEDNTYLKATDYHPIYTKDGWKSYTNRNNYPKPKISDEVLTSNGYKKITKINTYEGKEDYIDFKIKTNDGKIVNNYYANGILVEASYNE